MKTSPLRKFSKKEIPKLKRKLKILLHALIRAKYPKCYTCPAKTAHAGHYKNAGHYKSVEFDPDNIRGQCVNCNNFNSGRLDVYGDRLREEIGLENYKQLVWRAEKGHFDYTPKKLMALIEAAEMGLEFYSKIYDGLKPKK